jgi:hypothetical protein
MNFSAPVRPSLITGTLAGASYARIDSDSNDIAG